MGFSLHADSYFYYSIIYMEHSSLNVVILLKIQHPHTPARSLWGSMDGMLLYSGIAVFWVLAWFLSLDGAKADYNGGSLNSVNGTNLVKSVYCLQPRGSSCAQVHGNT